MNDTHITVVGRLVADPALRTTNGGAPWATFRIATNARRQKPGSPGEYEDGNTSYYNVRAFRALGANLAACLKKGQPVVVSGTLEITEYDRPDGSRGTAGEIVARAVGHDLAWGVTSFTKVARGGQGDPGVADPHVRASLQAMSDVMAEGLSGPEPTLDPATVEYDLAGVDEDLDDVDPLTGEVREGGRTAA